MLQSDAGLPTIVHSTSNLTQLPLDFDTNIVQVVGGFVDSGA